MSFALAGPCGPGPGLPCGGPGSWTYAGPVSVDRGHAAATYDLIVVANRLPVDRVVEADGSTSWRRSPGGLVTAVEPVMRELDTLNREMRDAGVWVFAAGLRPPETATVLRASGDDVLLTDGPYVEGKEHVGGFDIIEVPDLDAALHWGRRLARVLAPLAIEVRPFH